MRNFWGIKSEDESKSNEQDQKFNNDLQEQNQMNQLNLNYSILPNSYTNAETPGKAVINLVNLNEHNNINCQTIENSNNKIINTSSQEIRKEPDLTIINIEPIINLNDPQKEIQNEKLLKDIIFSRNITYINEQTEALTVAKKCKGNNDDIQTFNNANIIINNNLIAEDDNSKLSTNFLNKPSLENSGTLVGTLGGSNVQLAYTTSEANSKKTVATNTLSCSQKTLRRSEGHFFVSNDNIYDCSKPDFGNNNLNKNMPNPFYLKSVDGSSVYISKNIFKMKKMGGGDLNTYETMKRKKEASKDKNLNFITTNSATAISIGNYTYNSKPIVDKDDIEIDINKPFIKQNQFSNEKEIDINKPFFKDNRKLEYNVENAKIEININNFKEIEKNNVEGRTSDFIDINKPFVKQAKPDTISNTNLQEKKKIEKEIISINLNDNEGQEIDINKPFVKKNKETLNEREIEKCKLKVKETHKAINEVIIEKPVQVNVLDKEMDIDISKPFIKKNKNQEEIIIPQEQVKDLEAILIPQDQGQEIDINKPFIKPIKEIKSIKEINEKEFEIDINKPYIKTKPIEIEKDKSQNMTITTKSNTIISANTIYAPKVLLSNYKFERNESKDQKPFNDIIKINQVKDKLQNIISEKYKFENLIKQDTIKNMKEYRKESRNNSQSYVKKIGTNNSKIDITIEVNDITLNENNSSNSMVSEPVKLDSIQPTQHIHQINNPIRSCFVDINQILEEQKLIHIDPTPDLNTSKKETDVLKRLIKRKRKRTETELFSPFKETIKESKNEPTTMNPQTKMNQFSIQAPNNTHIPITTTQNETMKYVPVKRRSLRLEENLLNASSKKRDYYTF